MAKQNEDYLKQYILLWSSLLKGAVDGMKFRPEGVWQVSQAVYEILFSDNLQSSGTRVYIEIVCPCSWLYH